MRPWKTGAFAIALAIGYYLSGRLGLELAFVHSSSSPVWPPTGVAIAGLAILGLRFWPAIFVGAALFNLQSSGHLPSSLVIGAGNTAEAVLGAWVIRRLGRAQAFDRLSAIGIAVLGWTVAAALSASVGVAALVAFDLAPAAAGRDIAMTWFLGNLSGGLMLAPALILATERPTRSALAWLSIALAAAAAVAAFYGPAILLLALVPALAWPATRMGTGATALASLAAASVAVIATLDGYGPFTQGDTNESLLLLQVFVASSAVSMMMVAAGRRQQRAVKGSHIGSNASVWIALVPIALASLLIATVIHPSLERSADDRRDVALADLERDWIEQISNQGRQLQAASAFFAGSSEVTRSEFTAFVEKSSWLDIPGVQAVEFTRFVAAADADAFEAQRRADPAIPEPYRSEFTIHPRQAKPTYAVVDYVVPLAGNELALGLELTFSEERRVTVEQAIQTGQPRMSGPIDLVQSQGTVKGILIVYPVEQGGETIGVVNTVHVIEELAAGLGTGGNYQLTDPSTGEVLYGSVAGPVSSSSVDVAGQMWSVQVPASGYLGASERAAPWFALVAGALVSIGGGGVAYAHDTTRRRAEDMATNLATQLRQQERRLEEAERLAKMDTFRRRFLNLAAHELRTPLTPIEAALHVLKLKTEDPKQLERIEVVSRGTKRLRSVVDDLLQAARAEADEVALDKASHDIRELLEATAESYREPAAAQGTQIAVRGPPSVAQLDAERIGQVLDNLVSNAVKFTRNGNITLTVRERDGVEIEVKDDGAGFDATDQEELFRPFAQVHDPNSVTERGSGLGLYICKLLVELHDGKISLHSDGLGKGAVAIVALPKRGKS